MQGEKKVRLFLCFACQRGKVGRCWGRWVDHLDNQPWCCPNSFVPGEAS